MPSADISSEARIAVIVCSIVGSAAIIAVALLLLSWRQRQHSRRRKSHIRVARGLPTTGSSTQLISASPSVTGSGFPLRPPLRLRDREFLHSVLWPGSRSLPPRVPFTPASIQPSYVFPSSPICSPTTNKLVPRYERTPRIYPRLPQPPPTAHSPVPLAAPRGSRGILAPSPILFSERDESAPVATLYTGGPAKLSKRRNTPQDPREFNRFHPPPGSPPKYPLPPSPSLPPPLFLQIVQPLPDPAADGSPLESDARDIAELNKEYACEQRGSWGGSGGGGPGIALSPPKGRKGVSRPRKKKRHDNTIGIAVTTDTGRMVIPRMGEGELESLGGRY